MLDNVRLKKIAYIAHITQILRLSNISINMVDPVYKNTTTFLTFFNQCTKSVQCTQTAQEARQAFRPVRHFAWIPRCPLSRNFDLVKFCPDSKLKQCWSWIWETLNVQKVTFTWCWCPCHLMDSRKWSYNINCTYYTECLISIKQYSLHFWGL